MALTEVVCDAGPLIHIYFLIAAHITVNSQGWR
jgi:hypothetical protein